VRTAAGMLAFCFALGGCSVITERSTLGYGDYVTMNCDQLGQEAVRLMREAANHTDTAMLQLKAVKQASADKHC